MKAIDIRISTIIAGCLIFLHLGRVSLGNEPSSPAPSAVYAKIVLPVGHPYWSQNQGVRAKSSMGDARPVVESWIAKKAIKRGKTKTRAVTHWICLAEKGEKTTALWAGWGCPVGGRVIERTADGKISVELSGWAPFSPKIKGQVLSADIGSRGIAIVDLGDGDSPYAYVGLLVGPPATNTVSPQNQ